MKVKRKKIRYVIKLLTEHLEDSLEHEKFEELNLNNIRIAITVLKEVLND